MALWRLLHLVGVVFWIGVALAATVLDRKAEREADPARATVVRFAAHLQTWFIAPGAVLTVISGFMISFRYYQNGIDIMTPKLLVMQGLGLLGAVVVLAIVLPTVTQLVRAAAHGAETGKVGARFHALRRRTNAASMIAWVMAVIALASWVL